MTRLILIRHGQSQANLEGIFVGHRNSPLSALGSRQAHLTADYVVSTYKVDEVYASDLQRAYETGKAVADRLGMPVTADPALREIFAGQWEGVTFDALSTEYGEPYQIWLHDIGRCACPEGETVAQLQDRFVGALEKIAKANEGKTVVIATHATPVRTFLCHCAGRGLGEMKNIPWVSNASVTEAVYDEGGFRIVEAGHDAHLGALRSALPKNV